MTRDDAHDRRLTELHAPRRNRFFSGKLLSPDDLEREQDYGRAAEAQLNRLMLGAGVVCGLEVTVADDGAGVRVGPGLALDGWGRRIVVPRHCDVPLPAKPSPPLVVRLCFEAREGDPTPALEGEQAGSWIEGHRVEIREGRAPAGGDAAAAAAVELAGAGRLDEALAALVRAACARPPSDPCVTLATLTRTAGGRTAVDASAPRAVVPTNLVLLQLVAALAARVEELAARG
jgi:hypothetical protein